MGKATKILVFSESFKKRLQDLSFRASHSLKATETQLIKAECTPLAGAG